MFEKWRMKRKIKKKLQNINFDLIDKDNSLRMIEYKNGGEYCALKWLQSYVNGLEPMEPEEIILNYISTVAYYQKGVDPQWFALFALTVFKYIK